MSIEELANTHINVVVQTHSELMNVYYSFLFAGVEPGPLRVRQYLFPCSEAAEL